MIGTYFTFEECQLLIPLVIRKLDFLENFPLIGSESEKVLQARELLNYRLLLSKIFAAVEIGEFKKY